jgi:uncharacterized membrane protein YheB (UPF0754 family)
MMLTPGEGVIIVEKPDIFEVIYNEPQKQKLKNLIDRMCDYTRKTTRMDQLISQGYTKEEIEAVSNLYNIVYNFPKRKSFRDALQKLKTQNIPYNDQKKYENTKNTDESFDRFTSSI